MKKIYYQELFTAGFVLGLLYSLQQIISYSLNIVDSSYNWMFFIYGVAVIASTQLIYTRRVVASRAADQGFRFSQCLGFMVLCSLLAGIVVGIVGYFLQQVIDPAYGEQLYEAAYEQVAAALPNATEQQIDSAMSMTRAMMGIWGMIIAGMFTMLINGTLIGLITSVFVKRNPDIFADQAQ